MTTDRRRDREAGVLGATPEQPGTTGDQETGKRRWDPAYRAHCPQCRKSGRTFAVYGKAEHAAHGHAVKYGHATYVIDQYGIRVVGSDQRPGTDG
ncbi:hypothetical protein E1262_27870 [Jiangella aurantiaca]|uniref:Uncharacterized protein n=1 Tax=Jiangella aurantiaca TaxID=2530373 RepID=A0A4R4ZZ20_9ACTN|nr:hypothetical protein [Jiangella aurantiaca]TDD64551.1 hypothetical protein E1262_27870 [Jiangella aurantiaca]